MAIDRAHAGNGCLEVLRGSQHLGRIAHDKEELGEMHADPARVALAEAHGCDRVRCELAPGDGPRTAPSRAREALSTTVVHGAAKPAPRRRAGRAGLFFHCNLLHCSAPNQSAAEPRWALICCYNAHRNQATPGCPPTSPPPILLSPVLPGALPAGGGRRGGGAPR